VLETSHAIIVIHNHPYKLIINPLEVGAFSRTNLQQMVSVCVCVCVCVASLLGLFAHAQYHFIRGLNWLIVNSDKHNQL
jgi:lysylphosphatidylglycerol synthetase-like protein (DUF2156 family)